MFFAFVQCWFRMSNLIFYICIIQQRCGRLKFQKARLPDFCEFASREPHGLWIQKTHIRKQNPMNKNISENRIYRRTFCESDTPVGISMEWGWNDMRSHCDARKYRRPNLQYNVTDDCPRQPECFQSHVVESAVLMVLVNRSGMEINRRPLSQWHPTRQHAR